MKKIKTSLIILILGIVFSLGINAQPPMPQDPAAGGNQNPAGNPPGGAPLAPGTGILLLLAAGYGLYTVQNLRKRPVKE